MSKSRLLDARIALRAAAMTYADVMNGRIEDNIIKSEALVKAGATLEFTALRYSEAFERHQGEENEH